MGSIYTQMLPKALAAGAPPQTPNSEGERLRRLPVWHAEGEGRQFPSSPRAPETLGTPLSEEELFRCITESLSSPSQSSTSYLHKRVLEQVSRFYFWKFVLFLILYF